MECCTKSELGAKNVKFVDRPEFGLVLAQLDIEASLIGKFHSNPPSSFLGVFFGTCTTRHSGKTFCQDLKTIRPVVLEEMR